MYKSICVPFVIFFGLTACSAFGNVAASQNKASLFDGHSLSGWKVTDENSGSFVVENGAIVTKGARAHLFYNGDVGTSFKNFELTLKVKTEPNSNSGVFFHTEYQSEGWPQKGVEAQVNATQYDPRKTGSLYKLVDVRVYNDTEKHPKIGLDTNPFVTLSEAPSKDLVWFDYKIVVQDGQASTWVNGDLIAHWMQPKDWADSNRRLASGTIALQAHDPDSVVYFKDIYIKILPESE